MQAKRIASSLALSSIAAVGFIALAGPASAAYTDCPSGDGCLWVGTSYPGGPNAYFGGSVVLSSSNNKGQSIVNNGVHVEPDTVYWYDASDYTGSHITLVDPAVSGGQWRDPDLSNGTNATSTNWANKISSARFQ